ncbi:MAG: flagellar hook-basal body complex protein FliE [Bryobacteraceae bacterium]|nr:flagellar hook-basal body complex protein FliE [Bryobacteraceae bacterium]
MINPASGIAPVSPLAPLSSPAAGSAAGGSFSSVLQSAIQNVEASGSEASQLMDKFMAGEPVDLHTVALAGQKAGLQFEMLIQVRNKVVQAYQEVMRLQL